jgi:hypothetical protein
MGLTIFGQRLWNTKIQNPDFRERESWNPTFQQASNLCFPSTLGPHGGREVIDRCKNDDCSDIVPGVVSRIVSQRTNVGPESRTHACERVGHETSSKHRRTNHKDRSTAPQTPDCSAWAKMGRKCVRPGYSQLLFPSGA